MGRVFLNLIANAIEAMRPGGVLTIATRNEKKQFVIRIQDSGSGITEKNLIRVFDPFFSTKKKGTGLGLSTCQNIVTSHGGLIEVESALKKGSVFFVSLPFEPTAPKRGRRKSGTRRDATMVGKWDLKIGGSVYLQVPAAHIKHWIRTGKLKAGETVVRRAESSSWQKPEEIEELISLPSPASKPAAKRLQGVDRRKKQAQWRERSNAS